MGGFDGVGGWVGLMVWLSVLNSVGWMLWVGLMSKTKKDGTG